MASIRLHGKGTVLDRLRLIRCGAFVLCGYNATERLTGEMPTVDVMQIPEVVKFLATLGVGGLLAGVIFWFYRKDAIAHASSWQGQSEALLEVVKDNTKAVTALQGTTSALQVTIEALRHDMAERERAWLRDRRP